MKQLIFPLIVIFFGCTTSKKMQFVPCNGNILQVGLVIKGKPSCAHCKIEKDYLKDGFSLTLEDTSYKIIKFRIGYFRGDDILFRKEISGSKINKKNVNFLNDMRIGDFISIECIKITKNNEGALSTGMLILVI